MPIYAFRCAVCGHHFDRLQKLSDPDPSACPDCGAEGGIDRQVTAPSFRLAGSGWYETDFKKDGDRKRNLAAGEGGEGAKAGEGAKSGEGSSAGEGVKTGDTKAGNSAESKADKPAQSKADAKPAAQPSPKPSPSKPGD
jgi:putative FmdB family regulatory protein